MEIERQRVSPTDWLTRTKLQPPRLRDDLIPRQRLLSDLHDAVLSHALTLVSTPAGYGKTTLLAMLCRSFTNTSAAWLSLDEEDNEPAGFVAAVVATLQRVNPGCGAATQALLTSLPNPGEEARRMIGVLINEILDTLPGPVVLILEDLHRVTEPAIYAALDYLLDHAPSQLHLAVSARYDPPLSLARLRAVAKLAEVRVPHLRFTLEDAAAFLNERLRLNLSQQELVSLHAKTEGWAAGLRLLANSLDDITTHTARSVFITHLSQTDRDVFDFLADEVLGRQGPALRIFLLETSILPELSPALCQAVTGRADSAALLENIYRRNLFLVAVPGESGTVYRYHHLFAEFLRRQLRLEMPERLAELHLRAAEAENVNARAIAHLLAAELWEQAATRIEKAGDQLIQDGLHNTLRGWIDVLPAFLCEQHPRLLRFLGACAVQRGALEDARSLSKRAQLGFAAAGDDAGQGDALLELVNVASQQHDYESQAKLIREALTHTLPPHGQVQLLMARVWQSFHQGQMDQADADMDQALRITLECREPRAYATLAPILRMHLALLPGRADRLERYCHQALADAGQGVGPVQAGAHSLLGYLHFLCGRLGEAIREAEHAQDISRQLGGFTYLDVEVDFVLTSTALVRGECEAVERFWETRLPRFEDTPALRFYVPSVLHFIGRAQWIRGDQDRFRQTCTRIAAMVNPQELSEVKVCRSLMGALTEMSNQRYVQAERLLRAAVDLEQRTRPWFVFGSARLLLAHLYLLWKRPREALSELVPVLAECEQTGTPGLILQEGAIMVPLLRLAVANDAHRTFATTLLDLMEAGREPRALTIPDTGETLSPREVQVLGLIAGGASNQEIARQLVVSKHTVKVHVTKILAKIHASSRTQAAIRARELRLL